MLTDPLGEEAGAALSIGESHAGTGEPHLLHVRWLRLTLSAADLAPDAEERAAALVAATAGERPVAEGEPTELRTSEPRSSHLAMPHSWCSPCGERPATFVLPAPGAWRAEALLPAPGRPAVPELLCRLLLAELLDGIAAAHRRGWWHGLLTPASLWLAGAPPERLIADCPRDPRVVLVGCGVLAMLTPRARAAAVARAPRTWLAPELRRGGEPGPAADVWAAGAVVRELLPRGGVEMEALLGAMQSERPHARPSAAGAATSARELALAGLASWQRGAPPPPRLMPSPAPLLSAPGSRRQPAPAVDTDAARSSARREATLPSRWTLLPPAPSRLGLGVLPTMPFVRRPLPGGPAPALWLSMAPTAMAGILSVLLAMALLFAAP
ncbi:MAG TPA: hypothetical protein VFS60_01005 [Thermoanaerobaculia bacterium]|nr:hypothetical protein [Thermoanaerobaculia bacterium]